MGPRAALLGTVDNAGNPQPLMWGDPVSENPRAGDTEVWEFYNLTEDAHPIHVHGVQFQVLNRQPLAINEEGEAEAPVEVMNGAVLNANLELIAQTRDPRRNRLAVESALGLESGAP